MKKTATYGMIIAYIWPIKEETHRLRITAGGNLLEFRAITATQCDSLATTFLNNSTVSTPGEIFITMDLKQFTMARHCWRKITCVSNYHPSHYNL